MTGLEAALVKVCVPAAGRAAGGALGKIAGLPVATIVTRRRNRKTRQALSASTYEALCPHVSPETAEGIIEFLESPDFEAITLSATTQLYASKSDKSQKIELAETFSQLSQLLKMRLGDNEDTTLVANAIWNAAISKIMEFAEETKASETLGADARASMAKIAACFAAADAKSAEQLARIASLAEFHTFEKQLADQVRNLHSTMRLPHAGTTRKVPYSKLFVEPRILKSQANSDKVEPFESGLAEVLTSNHRVIVLGDPGGGKSTLSLKLAYDIARSSFHASSARVPLLFILRDYVEAFRTSRDSMVQFLESICRNPYNVEPPQGAIEYLLSSGRALVIFDGLDELTDTSLRRKVCDFVESFVYRYPATPVLVTSRRVGYNEAPLDESLFTVVSLGELGDEQVRSYAEKWFALDQTVERKSRSAMAASFIRESRFVADLRKNPLMLSLMCGIYASEHYIPSNRPDVYQKCAELLFERWDKQRGIVIPLPFNAHVRHALNALALRMYSDPKAQNGLTRSRLVSFMTDFLVSKRFDDEALAEDAANQFVDFCTGRAWVLTDMGSDTQQNLYGFTHRTFLEYFAANQLVRANSSAERLFDALHDHIASQEWEVVAQLSLQILGQNVEDGGDDFLSFVLTSVEDTELLKQKRNLVEFAARSLAFMVPRPQIVQMICEGAVNLSVQSMDESDFSHNILGHLLACSPENLELVSRSLRDVLLAKVEDEPGNAKMLLLALCFRVLANYTTLFADRLSSKREQVWESVELGLRERLQPLIAQHYDTEFWAAFIGATQGELSMAALIEKYGTAVLWSFKHEYWQPALAPAILRAGFRPMQQIYNNPMHWSATLDFDCCLAELADVLLQTKTPWIDSSDIPDHLVFTLLRACDGPLSYKEGKAKEGALLMFLPLGELSVKWSERKRLRGELAAASSFTRTHGLLRNVIQKLSNARIHSDQRTSAMATLRGLNLDKQTTQFIARWVNCEISTASYTPADDGIFPPKQ